MSHLSQVPAAGLWGEIAGARGGIVKLGWGAPRVCMPAWPAPCRLALARLPLPIEAQRAWSPPPASQLRFPSVSVGGKGDCGVWPLSSQTSKAGESVVGHPGAWKLLNLHSPAA